MVSPIFASLTVLMFATTKPTSPGAELADRLRLRREDADLLDLVVLPLRHQADFRALPQHAVEHPRDDDDATIRVVPRVEDERLERRR